MPNPSISPNTIGAGPYTISNSKCAIINLILSNGLGDAAEFTVAYPTGAGVQVTLIKGGVPLDLLPNPASQPFAGRTIAISTTPSGGNTILTCDITATSGASPGEAWTVQISGLAGGQCVFTLVQFTDVTRVMCDPVADFTISAATLAAGGVKEKDMVTLTSLPALGPPAAPTVVGGPAPAVSYLWSYAGSAAITAFNTGCVVSPNFIFDAPAVYGDATIALSLQVWFDSPCPTPGFLNNSTTTPQDLTIKARTQLLMLVLDRTGSMWGDKWDNAKIAARMLAQLFVSLRKGVSANDKVGIMVFEDNQCDWHNPPRDPSMDPPLLPLNGPGAVEDTICSLNLGDAGTCTPIGDALIQAMQDLHNVGAADNPAYTIVLLTDGIENSGGIRVDTNTTAPAFVQNFSSARTMYPDINNNLKLYTIGVGTDSQVQSSVLDQLRQGNQGNGMYRLVNDPTDIADAIVQMVSFSRDAAKVTLYPGDPPQADPDAGSIAQKRYFTLATKASRLAILLEWGATDPSDTIELAYRTWDSGASSFHGPFTPLAGATKKCPTHGFLSEDLATTLGGGDSNNVPATEWRVVHKRGGTPQAIDDNKIMIIEDLFVKADIVFDKEQYRTGDPIVITARLRAGDKPVTGATVTVELERPGEGMGTFLATNAPQYIPRVKLTSLAVGASSAGGDPANPKLALLKGIFDAKNMTALPYQKPPSILSDGSNHLFDDGAHHDGQADDGNYANVFTQADKEGTYTWRFTVRGKLPDGSPFSRVITLSKWIGVNVDVLASPVTVQYGLPAPAGYKSAQVFVTPLDASGEYLGPFWMSEVDFATTAGEFQGDLVSESDGQYSRLLLYKSGEVPVVTVTVQGKSFLPIPVASGCLGKIFSIIYAMLKCLLRHIR